MPLPSKFYLEKQLVGVALLLSTFPPSWNVSFGPTPHFIAYCLNNISWEYGIWLGLTMFIKFWLRLIWGIDRLSNRLFMIKTFCGCMYALIFFIHIYKNQVHMYCTALPKNFQVGMLICVGSLIQKCRVENIRQSKSCINTFFLLLYYRTLAFSLRFFVALSIDEESVCHELNS